MRILRISARKTLKSFVHEWAHFRTKHPGTFARAYKTSFPQRPLQWEIQCRLNKETDGDGGHGIVQKTECFLDSQWEMFETLVA